jgi:integrase
LPTGAGGDFDNRYSQRGVQWAVKQVAKAAGIIKVPHLTTLLCHAFAGRRHGYHDAQRPLGHQNVETTMEYLHIAQLESAHF